MNSKELEIFTALTHKNSPEDYRIVDDGTKIYVLLWRSILISFEGEGLDKMSSLELYRFVEEQKEDYIMKMW